jgi:nucleotide-binding universal stress UspA family protein
MEGFIPTRILIPINGGPTSSEAVLLGCRLARRRKAKVHVICILEVKRSLPIGAVDESAATHAEELLDNAERIGENLEIRIETELLQAREAGPAIVEEIKAWHADLLVVGMPFRQRYGEFYMGKTVPYLLRFAPCRALMFREPPPPASPEAI